MTTEVIAPATALFKTPLPLWDVWYLLAIPLCAGVAIVYKSMRCATMSEVPKAAAAITGWILGALIGAAVLLGLLVTVLEY